VRAHFIKITFAFVTLFGVSSFGSSVLAQSSADGLSMDQRAERAWNYVRDTLVGQGATPQHTSNPNYSTLYRQDISEQNAYYGFSRQACTATAIQQRDSTFIYTYTGSYGSERNIVREISTYTYNWDFSRYTGVEISGSAVILSGPGTQSILTDTQVSDWAHNSRMNRPQAGVRGPSTHQWENSLTFAFQDLDAARNAVNAFEFLIEYCEGQGPDPMEF